MKNLFTTAIITVAAIAALTTTGARPVAAAEFNYSTDCKWNMSKGMTDLPDDTFMCLIGDVDRNNVVDITDLTYLALYLVGEETNINEFKVYTRDGVGNLNSDDVISVVDLAIMRQFICHQITAQDIKDTYGNPAAVTTPAVTTPEPKKTTPVVTTPVTTTAVTTTVTTPVTTVETTPVTTTAVTTTEPEVTTTAVTTTEGGLTFGNKYADFSRDAMDVSIKSIVKCGAAESFNVTPAMNPAGEVQLYDLVMNIDMIKSCSFNNDMVNDKESQYTWDAIQERYSGNVINVPGKTSINWVQSIEYIYDANRNIVGAWIADVRVSTGMTAGATGAKSVRLYAYDSTTSSFRIIGARCATVIYSDKVENNVLTTPAQNRWFAFDSSILSKEDAEVFDMIIDSDTWFDDDLFR